MSTLLNIPVAGFVATTFVMMMIILAKSVGTQTKPLWLTLSHKEFLNSIIDQADAGCAGKNFNTRDAFLDAHNSYNQFGSLDNVDDSKREIVTHFTHEAGDFCYIEDINGASRDYCDETNTQPKKASESF
ncbi:hypothetical protein RJT34_31969 [Clitoria ternatea]|uniref:chitinase n=1 Tax=Clitoria ternatea TaxID=43366 RepID=A0AAN9EV62_CLITE